MSPSHYRGFLDQLSLGLLNGVKVRVAWGSYKAGRLKTFSKPAVELYIVAVFVDWK